MKLLKKIVIILMLNIIIITTLGIGVNKSNATDIYAVGIVELYSKSKLICLKYGDFNYSIDFVVYEEGDKQYPAYPLLKKSIDVADGNRVKTEVYGNLKDAVIRSVILNGYPFKQPKELGCDTEMDAYGATNIAINTILNGYELEKFEPFDEEGEKILCAAKKILENIGDPIRGNKKMGV